MRGLDTGYLCERKIRVTAAETEEEFNFLHGIQGFLPPPAAQMMPSWRSQASSLASIPSHEPSTSSTCWPSSGDGLTVGAAPSKRTGQAGILTLPVVGWSIVCMMPRSANEGSFISSRVSNTAPAGTPAAPNNVIASSL